MGLAPPRGQASNTERRYGMLKPTSGGIPPTPDWFWCEGCGRWLDVVCQVDPNIPYCDFCWDRLGLWEEYEEEQDEQED